MEGSDDIVEDVDLEPGHVILLSYVEPGVKPRNNDAGYMDMLNKHRNWIAPIEMYVTIEDATPLPKPPEKSARRRLNEGQSNAGSATQIPQRKAMIEWSSNESNPPRTGVKENYAAQPKDQDRLDIGTELTGDFVEEVPPSDADLSYFEEIVEQQ